MSRHIAPTVAVDTYPDGLTTSEGMRRFASELLRRAGQVKAEALRLEQLAEVARRKAQAMAAAERAERGIAS